MGLIEEHARAVAPEPCVCTECVAFRKVYIERLPHNRQHDRFCPMAKAGCKAEYHP